VNASIGLFPLRHRSAAADFKFPNIEKLQGLKPRVFTPARRG
jgi:hypothetical protein